MTDAPVHDPGQPDPSAPWRGVPWGWGLIAHAARKPTWTPGQQGAQTQKPAAGERLTASKKKEAARTARPAPDPDPPGGPLPPGAARRLREKRAELQRRCEAEGRDPADLVPGWKGYRGAGARQIWMLEEALGPAPLLRLPQEPRALSAHERQQVQREGEEWLR